MTVLRKIKNEKRGEREQQQWDVSNGEGACYALDNPYVCAIAIFSL